MQTEGTKKRFTVDEYYRMGEIGILQEDIRTELINGEIMEMSPMGARQASVVSRISEFMMPVLRGKAQLRPLLPLRLNDYNEPQPDLCFVRPRRDYYGMKHPGSSDTLLVIEVSDTLLRYDRDVKSGVYAGARVPEFWIVDLSSDVLLILRDPSRGDYKTCLTLNRGESAAARAFPEVEIAVADLLGPASE